MKFILTLILMMVTAIPAFAALPCDVALSRTLLAMLELTKSGLKKEMLKPAQLERDFKDGKFSNPFTRQRSSIEGGRMYDAFAEHTVDLSPEQQSQYRTELSKILAHEAQLHRISHAANEATRDV